MVDAFSPTTMPTRAGGNITSPGDVLKPTLPKLLRDRQPGEDWSRLESMLELIRINAEAERWDACHMAIDRLRSEAVLARPWRFPLGQRLAMPISLLGLAVRTFNRLEDAGLWTVQQLLDANLERLLGIENIQILTVRQIAARIRRLFQSELARVDQGADVTEHTRQLAEMVLAWPREKPGDTAGLSRETPLDDKRPVRQ